MTTLLILRYLALAMPTQHCVVCRQTCRPLPLTNLQSYKPITVTSCLRTHQKYHRAFSWTKWLVPFSIMHSTKNQFLTPIDFYISSLFKFSVYVNLECTLMCTDCNWFCKVLIHRFSSQCKCAFYKLIHLLKCCCGPVTKCKAPCFCTVIIRYRGCQSQTYLRLWPITALSDSRNSYCLVTEAQLRELMATGIYSSVVGEIHNLYLSIKT